MKSCSGVFPALKSVWAGAVLGSITIAPTNNRNRHTHARRHLSGTISTPITPQELVATATTFLADTRKRSVFCAARIQSEYILPLVYCRPFNPTNRRMGVVAAKREFSSSSCCRVSGLVPHRVPSGWPDLTRARLPYPARWTAAHRAGLRGDVAVGRDRPVRVPVRRHLIG